MPYPVAAVRGKNFGSISYFRKVLGTQSDDLIQYHPMNETAGGTAIDYSSEGNDGAYSNVTLNNASGFDGGPVPLFVPVSLSYQNIYSAGLNSDFNGQEVTAMIWAKVSGASVWTDGSLRRLFNIRVDGDNILEVYKHSSNNTVFWQYKAGATSKSNTVGSLSPTGWTSFMIAASKTGDTVKFFINGVQQGSTATGLGTWSGNLSSTQCILGTHSTAGPLQIWDGWLAHYAVWKSALDSVP